MFKIFLDELKLKRMQRIDEVFGPDPLKLTGAELKAYYRMHRRFDIALVVFFVCGVAAFYFFGLPWLKKFINY